MTAAPPVVDDALLARVLVAGTPAAVPGVESEHVRTTGLWWYRLARGVLGDGGGALSARLAGVDLAERRSLVRDLPPGVTVHGLATLAADAADLSRDLADGGVHLNALAAEAMAVAVAYGSDLLVATPSPSLATAADRLGLGYREVGA